MYLGRKGEERCFWYFLSSLIHPSISWRIYNSPWDIYFSNFSNILRGWRILPVFSPCASSTWLLTILKAFQYFSLINEIFHFLWTFCISQISPLEWSLFQLNPELFPTRKRFILLKKQFPSNMFLNLCFEIPSLLHPWLLMPLYFKTKLRLALAMVLVIFSVISNYSNLG